MQYSLNKTKQKAGLSEDKQLNIYDMASNCREWTTETYIETGPCVARGGLYNWTTNYPSSRLSAGAEYSFSGLTCRSILYL